jgi:cytoskeletal protein RodZ
MPTVAEQLRQAREAQRLDVYQVAETTKIKTDHIRALESGDYNVFNAPVYVRGFIRTYATMLKLNVAQVMADLDAELKQTEKFREPPALIDKPKSPLDFVMLQLSKLNWWTVLIGAVVVAGLYLVVVGLRRYAAKQADPHKNLGPGLYQPRGRQTGETLPLPGVETNR